MAEDAEAADMAEQLLALGADYDLDLEGANVAGYLHLGENQYEDQEEGLEAAAVLLQAGVAVPPL